MNEEEQRAEPSPSIEVKYFSIEKAVHDFKCDMSFGSVGDKVLSSAKLAGLTAANVGIWTGKLGFAFLKQLPEQLAESAAQKAKK